MKIIATLILTVFTLLFTYGQSIKFDKANFTDIAAFNDAKDNFIEGNDYYKDEVYFNALEYFLKANDFNPNNAELNYKIGVCYLHVSKKENALTFIEKSYALDSTYSEEYHYQKARAYQYLLQFDNAITEYNKYILNGISSKKEKAINKKIAECKTGIELVASPIKGKIHNLEIVNSEFADYGPMLTADESVLIFTSRRTGTTGNRKDLYDNEYYEDIYISRKNGDAWSEPEKIEGKLNTGKHDSNVGLSLDGQILYIYRSIRNSGDIYACKLDGDIWASPKALPEPINSKYVETSITLSPNGKTLYFVSNRPKGVGGKDIYSSTKNDEDKWGEAINLGAVINTEFDEDGVFIHPDGRTLYFSSKGHNTMGDYDIFKTEMDNDGNWQTPINVGYPINSPENDVFFFLSASGDKGYFSSLKDEGFGDKDIYYINFNEEDKATVEGKLALVKGRVVDSKTKEPIEVTLEIVDNSTQEIVANFKSNKSTGEYLVSLPLGINYAVTIEKNGYLFYSLNFNLKDSTSYKEIELEIGLPDTCVNSIAVLRNVFFDYGKTTLKGESKRELQRIYDLLVKYPTMRMEISGHTDNVSSEKFNQRLSENRAKSVAKYLAKMGIDSDRLVSIGYAFSQPVANNDTKEGRKKNRRVEFKVLGY